MESLKKILLIVWLSMMFVIPKEYGVVKAVVLLIICLIGIYDLARNKYVNKHECIYFSCFIFYFMASLLLGIISGWKFNLVEDYPLFLYYLFTPVGVFLLGNMYCKQKMLICKICIVVTFIITILNIVRIFVILGIISPISILDFLVHVDSENTLSNELTLRISNESSLIFLMPFNILLLSSVLNGDTFTFIYKFCIIGSSILGSIYAMLSGRRILEIGIILAWLFRGFYYLKHSMRYKDFWKGLIFIIIFFSIILYILNKIALNTDMNNIEYMIIDTFFEGFTGAGMKTREGYIPGLIDLWSEAPIFGNGLNAYGTVLANRSNLWSYEVVFLALLGQAGILGILIILIGVCACLKSFYRNYRVSSNQNIKNIYQAMSFSSIIFILAGLTNPQIYYIWFWSLFFTFSKNDEVKILHENIISEP